MIDIIDELKKWCLIVSPSGKTDKCLICSRRHTMGCPNSSKCFSLENKPYFKEGNNDSDRKN